MTARSSIDHARLLEEQLAQASPDLLRELLQTFINTLLSAEADAVCGAEYGTVSPERVNRRNGYRHRDFDTRAGSIDVAVPKLRQGSYFPEWLLERRKRAERALTSVVATCYLLGVSTRRMDKLVQTLGITGLSKSQVSVMARELDEHVGRLQHAQRSRSRRVSQTADQRNAESGSAQSARQCPADQPVRPAVHRDRHRQAEHGPAGAAPGGADARRRDGRVPRQTCHQGTPGQGAGGRGVSCAQNQEEMEEQAAALGFAACCRGLRGIDQYDRTRLVGEGRQLTNG